MNDITKKKLYELLDEDEYNCDYANCVMAVMDYVRAGELKKVTFETEDGDKIIVIPGRDIDSVKVLKKYSRTKAVKVY